MFAELVTLITDVLAIELPLSATVSVSLGAVAIFAVVFRLALNSIRGFIH